MIYDDKNKEIAKILNINHKTSVVGQHGNYLFVMEDLGSGILEEQPDVHKAVAYIPKITDKNTVVHDIIGEMDYYFEKDKYGYLSIISSVAKADQEPTITTHMLRFLECIAVTKEVEKSIFIPNTLDEEILEIFAENGYLDNSYGKVESERDFDAPHFALKKRRLAYYAFNNNYELLLKQAKGNIIKQTNEDISVK